MMSDVIRAVAELRQRRLETEDIELHLEDRAEQSVKAVLTEQLTGFREVFAKGA